MKFGRSPAQGVLDLNFPFADREIHVFSSGQSYLSPIDFHEIESLGCGNVLFLLIEGPFGLYGYFEKAQYFPCSILSKANGNGPNSQSAVIRWRSWSLRKSLLRANESFAVLCALQLCRRAVAVALLPLRARAWLAQCAWLLARAWRTPCHCHWRMSFVCRVCSVLHGFCSVSSAPRSSRSR